MLGSDRLLILGCVSPRSMIPGNGEIDFHFTPDEERRIDLRRRIQARVDRETEAERNRLNRPLSSTELHEIIDRIEREEGST